MQIMNGGKVLFEIPLPPKMENAIDRVQCFCEREQKYLRQILLIALIVIVSFRL